MIANRFTVILDTNVLYGGLHRNIALTLAEGGLYRPRWSAQILIELKRGLEKRIGDPKKAESHCRAINEAFPEALVEISESAQERLTLPDDDDRHVLAAAIKARAAQIVTDNLTDFPVSTLAAYEIEAVSSDHFFSHTIALSETEAVFCLRKMRERLKKREFTPEGLVLRCEQVGLPETASVLNDYLRFL